MSSNRVVRLPPYYFIHVLDGNENVTRVECGPKTFVRQDHEQITLGVTAMINIPPRHYCIIGNPVERSEDSVDGVPQSDGGQVQLRHGDVEVRLHEKWSRPFPLYPGEWTRLQVTILTVVPAQKALRIMAVRNCMVDGQPKIPGDEWLFKGPGTYTPRIEEKVTQTIIASVVMMNQALNLRAKRNFTDRTNVARIKGESWLITKLGSYIPDVYEEVIKSINARVLTEKTALHLTALRTFTDVYGKERKAGSEWLITLNDSQTHLPGIHERICGEVNLTFLSQQQYCVVLNPVKDGQCQWGKRELRKGECQFFLAPGEKLETGIQEAKVLGADEALLLRARQNFQSSSSTTTTTITTGQKEEKVGVGEEKVAGQEWLIYGPRKYIPPAEVEIIGQKRRAIPLDENEGIYVRNTKTGEVTTIKGKTYLLATHEEKWSKPLSPQVEDLLGKGTYRGLNARNERVYRDPTKAVSYRVPHNCACQIFDYKKNVTRVVIGPEMIMMEPFEEFTVVSLSGGRPKQENKIKSLTLSLGPDFMNDNIIVETSDHAKLSLLVSYNWHFELDRTDEKQKAKLFSVRDFIGDCCKALASRVRGAVASQTFDNFHKQSAQIIKAAVFGNDKDGNPNNVLQFQTNLLTITNVDIQTVEPVEQRTRNALAKSVQLAIEITRQSREKMAAHNASKEEQIAKDNLLKQKIIDQALSEADRETLVRLKAETLSAAAVGKAKAEARARVEEAMILANAAVKQAEQKVKAREIRATARLSQLKMQQKQKVEHKKALDKIEIDRIKKESDIEVSKFRDIVTAIGPKTIEAIARAGPEMQAKLLEGLGLQGFLVTDGTSPINLFNTANGLVGNQ